MKPVVKWAGGKRKLLPQIEALMTGERGVLVEPFVGGASVSLGIDFETYFWADSNAYLISLYHCLMDNPYLFLFIHVKKLFENGNTAKIFHERRDLFNSRISEPPSCENTALFLYLNKHCYSGLCRFNKAGEFNTPFANYKNVKIDFLNALVVSEFLKEKRVSISHIDYKDTFDLARNLPSPVTIYCDPPYIPDKPNAFVSYNSGVFGLDDHIQLAHFAKDASDNGCHVIISNSVAAVDIYKGIIPNAEIQDVEFNRAMGREKAKEILVLVK